LYYVNSAVMLIVSDVEVEVIIRGGTSRYALTSN
jgi:hypothetical protein